MSDSMFEALFEVKECRICHKPTSDIVGLCDECMFREKEEM